MNRANSGLPDALIASSSISPSIAASTGFAGAGTPPCTMPGGFHVTSGRISSEKWTDSSPDSCEWRMPTSPGMSSSAVTRHLSFSTSVYHLRLCAPGIDSPRQPCWSGGSV